MPGRPPFAPSLRSVSSRVWTAGSPSVLTAVSREVSPCLLPATTGPGRSSAPSSARGHAFSRLRRSVGPQRLRALVWSPCSSRSPLPYGRITSTWPCEAVGMILEKNTEASPLAPGLWARRLHLLLPGRGRGREAQGRLAPSRAFSAPPYPRARTAWGVPALCPAPSHQPRHGRQSPLHLLDRGRPQIPIPAGSPALQATCARKGGSQLREVVQMEHCFPTRTSNKESFSELHANSCSICFLLKAPYVSLVITKTACATALGCWSAKVKFVISSLSFTV